MSFGLTTSTDSREWRLIQKNLGIPRKYELVYPQPQSMATETRSTT